VSTPILTADHLSKWYGQVIGLNDVTVNVPPGITGLLGPNGAGKSTFMKLITGQLRPSKGSVTVLGEPIWGNPKLFFRIGFCPEQDVLRADDRPPVGDRARPAQRSRRPKPDAAERALTVDLMDAANKRRGLQQRHAPTRQARAGARPRSGTADPG
jgi:ABC-2 type transport system ATP-binding protein